MSNLNILIYGSGIAGSVFAYCLLRAYRHADITIVERDPSLRLTGASVDVRSSAVAIAESIDHFQQRDDGVLVTFATSKAVEKYDLLIAADGVRSMISAAMLNTSAEEHILSKGVHVAYFTIKRDLPARRELETRQKLDEAIRNGNECYMTLTEERFEDAGWLAPELLQGTRQREDFYCSLFGRVSAPKLQDGRVVLLGDAGYATPGIGTSLTIFGGYVLAGELLNHGDDIKMAARGYEHVRLPHINKLANSEDPMQYLNPQTWWGIRIRNAILGTVTGLKLDKMG
ncbi:MAG: hypothetical protein Q9204_004135, partial [Flavoplaca sp. TL-2023a]